jgi:two-component system, NtrC family, sensor histidine kinase HydH
VVDTPADFEALQRGAMRRLVARMIVVRVGLAPVLLAIIALTLWLDPAPWRVALGSSIVTLLVALTTVEYLRLRMDLLGPLTFPFNAVGMFGIQIAMVAVTGGLDSPVLPVVPLAAFIGALTFGRSLPQAAILLVQLTTVWTFASIDASGGSMALPQLGPIDHGPVWAWTAATFLSIILFGATAIGSKVRGLVGEAVGRALGAHESERQAHAEHAREMVALSAEIAHELKNPLASVKGLAALLARDLVGKPAERLGVLRSEVDRMQETLEEFLDFSRPLAPLARAPVDLGELAREVSTLCEGVARSRGVELLCDAGPVVLEGDRRKLRQLLVNLVQNAIEASPAGARVEIGAEAGRGAGDPVRLEVRDRGAGVAPDLDAFAPGLTTKPRGSGLGLTIARALVQQHGGRIELLARDGGGTRAAVTIPGAT